MGLHMFVLRDLTALQARKFAVVELALKEQVQLALRMWLLAIRTALILTQAYVNTRFAGEFIAVAARYRALDQTQANVASENIVYDLLRAWPNFEHRV